eukprot:225036-Prymnesium_polylepis.1
MQRYVQRRRWAGLGGAEAHHARLAPPAYRPPLSNPPSRRLMAHCHTTGRTSPPSPWARQRRRRSLARARRGRT